MSYDLHFRPRPEAPFGFGEVDDFFADRPFYRREGEADQPEYCYEHPDTGEVISLRWQAPPARPPPRQGAVYHNPNPPHVFGLEAADELDGVIAALSPAIEDPQTGGTGSAPYLREAFLQRWSAGNRSSLSAVFARQAFDPPAAPAQDIAEAWRWNRNRAALQSALEHAGDAVFVPTVLWFEMRDASHPVRCVVWGDNVPTLIPECADAVVLMGYAPQPLWARVLRRPPQAPVTFGALSADHVRDLAPLRIVTCDDHEHVATMANKDRSKSAARAVFEAGWPHQRTVGLLIPADRLLEEELIAEARATSASKQGVGDDD